MAELNENLLEEVNGGMNKEELVGTGLETCTVCGRKKYKDGKCPFCEAGDPL